MATKRFQRITLVTSAGETITVPDDKGNAVIRDVQRYVDDGKPLGTRVFDAETGQYDFYLFKCLCSIHAEPVEEDVPDRECADIPCLPDKDPVNVTPNPEPQ